MPHHATSTNNHHRGRHCWCHHSLRSGPGLEVQFQGPDQILMAKSVPASLIGDPDAAAKLGSIAKKRLEEAFPSLRDIRLLSSTIGARPYPKDTNPMLGPVEGVDGLFTAIGHTPPLASSSP